ncbi:hypothetical protein Tco_1237278 [Tanacetum coccineum]
MRLMTWLNDSNTKLHAGKRIRHQALLLVKPGQGKMDIQKESQKRPNQARDGKPKTQKKVEAGNSSLESPSPTKTPNEALTKETHPGRPRGEDFGYK